MLHTTQIKIIEKKKKIPPFFGWSPWEAKTPDPAGSPGSFKKKNSSFYRTSNMFGLKKMAENTKKIRNAEVIHFRLLSNNEGFCIKDINSFLWGKSCSLNTK